MIPKRNVFSIIIMLLVCILAVFVVYLILRDTGTGHDSIIVAFPSSVNEEALIDSFNKAGIHHVCGASNTLVPLSDFSIVKPVTFINADDRVREGDPRQTLLLDELRGRFTIDGPEGHEWSCIYLKVGEHKDRLAAAGALDALGVPWAWNVKERNENPALLWLPGLVWSVVLIARKPRRSRLGRAIMAIACVPLLFGNTAASALLYMALVTASIESYVYVVSGRAALMRRFLWQYALVSIAIVVFYPATVPLLLLSLVLSGLGHRYVSRIVGWMRRHSLHKAPPFVSLTSGSLSTYTKRVRQGLLIPLIALLLLLVVGPRGNHSIVAQYGIVQGMRHGSGWASEVLVSHMAFQNAITFGRIGDAGRDDGQYVPAYRYLKEDGKMMRIPGSIDRDDWPSEAFNSAIEVLSEAKPMAIKALSHKTLQANESALP